MKKIVGFGMLGTCGIIFLYFAYIVIPDWRIHVAFWGFIALLFGGLGLVNVDLAKSLPNSGDGTVGHNPEVKD